MYGQGSKHGNTHGGGKRYIYCFKKKMNVRYKLKNKQVIFFFFAPPAKIA